MGSPRLVEIAYGPSYGGVFYGSGRLLACEIIGVLLIVVWTFGVMGPFFLILNALGMFRVPALEETVGLDISHHKGSAYDLAAPDQEAVDSLAEKRATAHGRSQEV